MILSNCDVCTVIDTYQSRQKAGIHSVQCTGISNAGCKVCALGELNAEFCSFAQLCSQLDHSRLEGA